MGGTAKVFEYLGKRLSYRHRYGLDESFIKVHNKSGSLCLKFAQHTSLPWIDGYVSLGLGLETEFTVHDPRDFDASINLHLGPTRLTVSFYYCVEEGEDEAEDETEEEKPLLLDDIKPYKDIDFDKNEVRAAPKDPFWDMWPNDKVREKDERADDDGFYFNFD